MKLRPYQLEVARAVMDSIQHGKGLTLSVEIARQGGKNELSAHLEVLLLTLYMASGGSLIKCSPTFKPQATISIHRLKERLGEFGFDGIYRTQMGYIIQLGASQTIFLSAEESSSVVGHTADILLEIDESQDVSKEKYTKEFRPMGSATNVTTVHYGTTWDDFSLLEEIKQTNLELERRDGIKRHFRYDWHQVARYNPGYLKFVQAERDRLGEDHPLFQTQYALLPISGGGRLLSREQIAGIQGKHQRLSCPENGKTYVAGVDLAGEPSPSPSPSKGEDRVRDSTVITIAEVDFICHPPLTSPEPSLKVVEHYQWIGIPHNQLYSQMVHILKDIWNCHRVVVDATGMGQPLASFLRHELGSKVIPFTFTQKSKSELGFELLALINSNRLKIYQQEGSPQYQELIFELKHARARYRPNQTINFYVEPSEGHDDFLMSLALMVKAAQSFHPRQAKGWLNPA
ncbi:MAG: hypothetical protein SU899_05135 [Chloroflexota bacterium]|nr:hypothetical protein [Chloroflexota bacterium]